MGATRAGEDEPRVEPPRDELQRRGRTSGEGAATRALRLHGLHLPVRERTLDRERACVTVDIAPLEHRPLGRPKPPVRSDDDERCRNHPRWDIVRVQRHKHYYEGV